MTVRSAVRFPYGTRNGDNAEQQLRLAIRRIDRAVTRASYTVILLLKKSRLTKKLNKMQAMTE